MICLYVINMILFLCKTYISFLWYVPHYILLQSMDLFQLTHAIFIDGYCYLVALLLWR